MSKIIPRGVVNVMRTFNDLRIELYGIDCTIYVPTNLTALESNDIYTSPADIEYKGHYNQKVWIEWYAKDLYKLRKLGIFSEHEAPITAWFKLMPEVTIGSYFKVESRFIPEKYDTDEFEVVDVVLKNTYDNEIYRRYKIAPRRAK